MAIEARQSGDKIIGTHDGAQWKDLVIDKTLNLHERRTIQKVLARYESEKSTISDTTKASLNTFLQSDYMKKNAEYAYKGFDGKKFMLDQIRVIIGAQNTDLDFVSKLIQWQQKNIDALKNMAQTYPELLRSGSDLEKESLADGILGPLTLRVMFREEEIIKVSKASQADIVDISVISDGQERKERDTPMPSLDESLSTTSSPEPMLADLTSKNAVLQTTTEDTMLRGEDSGVDEQKAPEAELQGKIGACEVTIARLGDANDINPEKQLLDAYNALNVIKSDLFYSQLVLLGGEQKNYYSDQVVALEKKILDFEEKQKGYTLNKSDFEQYFQGDNFQQQNIGNCWLVSTIDSLTHLKDYESLIRRSVTKETGQFVIIMPLGSPKGQGRKYIIDPREFSGQTSIYGDVFNLIEAKDGIKALMIAYGKLSTGKDWFADQFDLMLLNGGNPSIAFNTMIYGVNSYSRYREDVNSKEGTKNVSSKEDRGFVDELSSVLKNFNPQTSILSVAVNQGVGYDQLGDYRGLNHAVSVEKTYTKNGELYITLSNPHDSNKNYDIVLSDLLGKSGGYHLGTFEPVPGLSRIAQSDKDNRVYSNDVIRNQQNDIKSLNEVIQLTGGLNKLLSFMRGDVTVSNTSKGLHVKSWQEDAYVAKNGEDLDINIGDKHLLLPSSVFSDTFQDINNNSFKYYLYAPRLAVFISKMQNDYIDQKKGDQSNKSPFALDKKGNITFDDDPTKWEGDAYTNRRLAEFFLDDTVTCLRDWSKLGIRSTDHVTKKKIVDFLNQLYST